jgi:hypothetical protein
LREKKFQFFLYGEKEDFEKYFLNLEYAALSFPILNNYSTERRQPYPQATVLYSLLQIFLLHSNPCCSC